jgi:alanyl-tRNA synthetase
MKYLAILALLGSTAAVKLNKISLDDLEDMATEFSVDDITPENLEKLKSVAKEHWSELTDDAKATLKELEKKAKAHFAAQKGDGSQLEELKAFAAGVDLDEVTMEDLEEVQALAKEHWAELSDDVKAALKEAKAKVEAHLATLAQGPRGGRRSAAQKGDAQLAKLKAFASTVDVDSVTAEDLEEAKALAKAHWAELSDDVKAAVKEV